MKSDIVLDTARQLVTNDRVKNYGTPRENFTRIANIWSEIFNANITPAQVALCMAAVKITRLIQTPDHADSWVDLAGYAACGGEVAEGEVSPPATRVHDRTHLQRVVDNEQPQYYEAPAMFGGLHE